MTLNANFYVMCNAFLATKGPDKKIRSLAYKLIMIMLAECADENDEGIATYSLKSIAERASTDPQTVYEIISCLEREGYVTGCDHFTDEDWKEKRRTLRIVGLGEFWAHMRRKPK